MPKGMLLKSDGFATNLAAPGNAFSLERFYKETGRPNYSHIGLRIPLDTLVEYGLEFQRRHVGAVDEAQVVKLERAGKGFNLTLDTGEQLSARKVVVATGPLGLQNVPDTLLPLSPPTLSHSSDLHDLSRFKDRRVIVVGAGQSAVESAALLSEQGAAVTLLTRRPLFWFDPENEDDPELRRSVWQRLRRPNFGLGPGWRTWFWSEAPYGFRYLPAGVRQAKAYSTFGPAGSGWLKARVAGIVPIHTGTLRHAEERFGEVRITVDTQEGAATFAADHVVAATGYKADIRRIPFLDPIRSEIRTLGGAPALNHWFESTASGLHFVGYASAPSFGPSMRFIYGTRFAASRVARSTSVLGAGRKSASSFTPQQVA